MIPARLRQAASELVTAWQPTRRSAPSEPRIPRLLLVVGHGGSRRAMRAAALRVPDTGGTPTPSTSASRWGLVASGYPPPRDRHGAGAWSPPGGRRTPTPSLLRGRAHARGYPLTAIEPVPARHILVWITPLGATSRPLSCHRRGACARRRASRASRRHSPRRMRSRLRAPRHPRPPRASPAGRI